MTPQHKKIAEIIKWFSSEMEKLTTLHWRERLDNTSLYSEVEALEMKLRNKFADLFEEEDKENNKGLKVPLYEFNRTQFEKTAGVEG